MKKTKILLISMTALLLAACGTKKAVVQQKPVQDTKVTQPTAPAPKDNKLQSVVAMQRITDNALYQKNLVSNLLRSMMAVRTLQYRVFCVCVKMRLSAYSCSSQSFAVKWDASSLPRITFFSSTVSINNT